MHFELAGWSHISRVTIPIDQRDFERIKSAKTRLFDVLYIEEKYNMLLENYQEFEKSLLDLTLNHMLFEETMWESLVGMGYRTTRHLQNVLSMARLYLDQVRHDLNSIYGPDSEGLTAFDNWTSTEYNGRLGYRVMEALRNFMQHRGLPAHTMEIGGHLRDLTPEALRVYTISPSLDIAKLREEGGFKAAVLVELEQKGQATPLKPLLREYMEGLASTHSHLRSLLAADISDWERILCEAMERFTIEHPKNPHHISIVMQNGDGTKESHDIFNDFLRRLHWLQHRNSKYRLSNQIVSSE